MENPNAVPNACSKFYSEYVDKNHQYILTGDFVIISNARLINFVFIGPKYREPVNISWQEAKTQIVTGQGNFLLIKALALVTFVNGKTK